jgi:hypothetical protein
MDAKRTGGWNIGVTICQYKTNGTPFESDRQIIHVKQ